MAALTTDVDIEFDGNAPPTVIQVKGEAADTYFRGGIAHHTAGLLQLTPTATEESAGVIMERPDPNPIVANDLINIAITGRFFFAFAGALDADFMEGVSMPAAALFDNPADLVVNVAGTAGQVGILDHVTSTAVSGWVNISRRSAPTNIYGRRRTMPGPINVDLTRRINKEAFYAEIEASKNERVWPKFAERIMQESASTIRPGFGSIPKPVQISGTAAGMSSARIKGLKDYSYTTTVQEWDLSVGMKRSLFEDNMEEAGRIGRLHGQSASVWFDEHAITQLGSTTALGYDGIALYSGSHAESGTNQDNDRTTSIVLATTPTAAEIEAAITENLIALRDFRDDHSRPVNEGVSRFTILGPPESEHVMRLALDPNLSGQAIDSSGVTGTFRGMFDIWTSAYVTNDRYYIFANNRTRSALGLYVKTDWDYFSNIGTDSDAWRLARQAVFTGYARFDFAPRDWKTTTRHVFTTT